MNDNKIIIKIDPIIAPLIPDFLNNRARDVETLKAALQDGDYENIRITGHNLKGCGAGYGFQGITDIGAEIELAAKSKDINQLDQQIEVLSDYLMKIHIEEDQE